MSHDPQDRAFMVRLRDGQHIAVSIIPRADVFSLMGAVGGEPHLWTSDGRWRYPDKPGNYRLDIVGMDDALLEILGR